MAATTIDIKDPDTEARPEGQRPIKSGRDSWPFSLFLRGGDVFFHFFSDSCQMLGIIIIGSGRWTDLDHDVEDISHTLIWV